MSVFLCKSGTHQGKWACKVKQANGKWTTKYCATEEIARQIELEALPEQKGEKIYTLGELAVLYLQANERHKITVASIVHALCGYTKGSEHREGVAEFLRDKPAERLTRQDLETLRQNLRSMHNAKNSTLNLYQSRFRAILAWSVDQDLISLNPWQNYKQLPLKRPEICVSYEAVRLVYLAAPSWLQWAIKTAYCLCLRPGQVELFGLRWTAFNWRGGYVRIKQGKSGMIKTVFPPEAYMAEAKERYEKDRADGIELVCHRNGFQVKDYKHAWKRAIAKAGVKLRPYDIRHLAASEMLANGADLAAVAAQMGHANVAMTGKVYAHVMAGAQARAAQALTMM